MPEPETQAHQDHKTPPDQWLVRPTAEDLRRLLEEQRQEQRRQLWMEALRRTLADAPLPEEDAPEQLEEGEEIEQPTPEVPDSGAEAEDDEEDEETDDDYDEAEVATVLGVMSHKFFG